MGMKIHKACFTSTSMNVISNVWAKFKNGLSNRVKSAPRQYLSKSYLQKTVNKKLLLRGCKIKKKEGIPFSEPRKPFH